MTKKMLKAIETLDMRMDLAIYLYTNKVSSRYEAMEQIDKLKKDFNELRMQCYRFGFISRDEYRNTMNIADEMSVKYKDKLLN